MTSYALGTTRAMAAPTHDLCITIQLTTNHHTPPMIILFTYHQSLRVSHKPYPPYPYLALQPLTLQYRGRAVES